MKNKLKDKQAQMTLEFAVLIVCIVGALVAMQFYIARSLQGRHRQTANTIGEQYDSRRTTADISTNFTYDSVTVVNTTDIDGRTTITTQADFNEDNSRVGSESVEALP